MASSEGPDGMWHFIKQTLFAKIKNNLHGQKCFILSKFNWRPLKAQNGQVYADLCTLTYFVSICMR